ncbi:MAG: prepilin-type N-terminal cleavage/methylation domain-containing protein [Candidatus Omnitrophica bacterium]|nr:prepilin-type N-terminal cleavage/methylation domain-containing protein [Candidatus Omnitrophota bacterium]MBF0484977.1 prepilin-type N-terminal cleavage/methylation domain-containing protein [Candidatus Omnitrophota bacterium]
MKNGFTLMEIILVIVILGILGTIAIPRFTSTNETAVAGEAVQILTALHGSQARYCIDYPALCVAGSYPTVCSTYDVDVPAAMKNFRVLTVAEGGSCQNSGNLSLKKINGTIYTVTVSPANVFSCSPAGNGCSMAQRIFP